MRTAPFLVVRARLHEFFGHSLLTLRPAAIIGGVGVQTISHVYRFGRFELDPGRRLLVRGEEAIWLPERQMDVLLFLVPRAGQIVPKEALFEAAGRGVAVTDNSIAQAVHGLRSRGHSLKDAMRMREIPRERPRSPTRTLRGTTLPVS